MSNATPRPPFSALFDGLKPRKASPPPASQPLESELVHMPTPPPLPDIPDFSDPEDEEGPTHHFTKVPAVLKAIAPPSAPAALPVIPAIPALPAPPGWHVWGQAYWDLRTGRLRDLRPSQAPWPRKPRARLVSTLSPDEQARDQLERDARLARVAAAHPSQHDLDAKMGAWAEMLGLCGDCMRPRKLSADNAKDCDRCAHRHILKDVPTIPPPRSPLPARDDAGRVSGVAKRDSFIEFDLTTP